MQATRLFFVFFILCFSVSAQNVVVGVPFNGIVKSQNTNLIKNCPSGRITIDNALINEVPMGTALYFKISASTLGTGCLDFTNVGVMNAGDSIQITTSLNEFEWSSLCGIDESATCEVVLAGTPLNVGDSLFCFDQWKEAVSVLVDGCTNYLEINYYAWPLNPECAVQDQGNLTLSSAQGREWVVFPNPSNSKANIRSEHYFHDAAITITDCTGKRIMSIQNVEGKELTLDFSTFEQGTYFIEIEQDAHRAVEKFLRLE